MSNNVRISSVKLWRDRLILAAILTIPFVYFLMVDLFGNNIPFARELKPYTAPVSFVIATVAIVYLGSSFFHNMIRGLKNRLFNMDSIIFIGTATAYVYSWVSYLAYIVAQRSILMDYSFTTPHLYFETVVFLFLFVTLGKYVEARATHYTSQSVRKLLRLRPRRAHLINSGNHSDIPARRIQPGDRILVLPNETIPADGVIARGTTSVDESMITGESITIDKKLGDSVVGGTINGHGQIEIIASASESDSVLSRIVNVMQSARATHKNTTNISDRIATIFVPFIIAFALTTFAIWFYIFNSSLSAALIAFISVLMIACPCAFGLAVPTALTIGIDRAAKLNIFVRNALSLQKLAKVDTIIFDKTGTLTEGKPAVTDIVALQGTNREALQIAASLERDSSYALGQAIVNRATHGRIKLLSVSGIKDIAGQGISGKIDGKKYFIGNANLALKHLKCEIPDTTRLHKSGKHVCYLSTATELIAYFAISDRPKPTAAHTIRTLHKMGIDTYLLSGDNSETAKAIASRLGIKKVISHVTPEGKVNTVAKLQREGKRVAMLGDGVNDAPAIAAADVGLAIGTGADIAIEAGEIVLASGDPIDICHIIHLAKATNNKAYQNIFFAIFYNLISMPIAAGALAMFGVQMHPELASLIMALSSIAVVVNSATLRTIRLGKRDAIAAIAPITLFILFSAIYLLIVIH